MPKVSLPPRDVNLCVFFLNKQRNNTKNHGNQVRKNENTFAVRTNKSWMLSRSRVLRVVLGDQTPLSHLDNQGTRHPAALAWACMSPGASGSPSVQETLPLASRDPFSPGLCHPERAGQPRHPAPTRLLPDKQALRRMREEDPVE